MQVAVAAPASPVGEGEGRHRIGAERLSRRRFVWGSSVGVVVSAITFAWMVTGGTWQFFRSVPFSNFYDVQARSFLHGTWSMPASVLSIEGIKTAGRTDMYYGPVPALLRMPILLFTHRFDGRLTEVSLLAAFVLALVFASLLNWRIRGMVRGQDVVSWVEAVLTAGLVVVMGVGSALLFLGATAQVYEEAEMWGATLALGALYALAGFVVRPSWGRLIATTGLTTLDLLTRGSVGAGPLVALGLVAAVYLAAWASSRISRWRLAVERATRLTGVKVAERPNRFVGALLASVAAPVLLYAWINEIKFGTPFSIPLNRQVATLGFAHRRAVLAANGGSLFGLKFLPTNLLQFLRPDALTLRRLFPWVFFPGKAFVVGNVMYTTRDWTSSITASMPFLTVLGVVGLVLVYRRTRHGRHAPVAAMAGDVATTAPDGAPGQGGAPLRLLLLGAGAGTLGVLVIAFVAERYLADIIPLLFLAAIAGWHGLMRWWPERAPARHRRAVRTAVAVTLSLLAIFELWTSLSLSVFYQRELGPTVTIQQRAGLVSLQQRLLDQFGGGPTPDVLHVTSLPKRAAPLELAVLGHCGGVFQFDGNAWQPVEIGGGAGGLLFEVAFPRTERGRRQPLLVSGGTHPQDVVALTWEGGRRYRFSFLFDSSLFGAPRPPWFTAPVFELGAGPTHQVQVDLVSTLGQVYVTVDGSTALSLLYPVAPPTHLRLGRAPPSLSTTATFAGHIRQRSLPTPICDRLERGHSSGSALRPTSRPPASLRS